MNRGLLAVALIGMLSQYDIARPNVVEVKLRDEDAPLRPKSRRLPEPKRDISEIDAWNASVDQRNAERAQRRALKRRIDRDERILKGVGK